MNQTIFQFFHWYYSAEGNLWNHAKDQAQHLESLGVTYVWLPPAYKSAYGASESGYAVYDLYDLGEFDQKGSVRTKYGTKAEYVAAIEALHNSHMKVLADVVLNHKLGGDEKEQITVRKVSDDNRNEFISEEHTVEAHTLFTFPGRKDKYSNFVWNNQAFTGICEDGSIGMIMNEYSNGNWEEMIENEMGNFDYLMGNDIEFRNPHVREELKKWICWYVENTGIDGFRLDALKHINPMFFPEWLDNVKECFKQDFFCIGEYWQNNIDVLINYINITKGRIQLFDVPLHANFHHASLQKETFDMRSIFDNTLMKEKPELAITFVDNHDTQPLQSLASTVDFWFKPLAYAIILLRMQSIPCVFYPCVYEAKYSDKKDGEEYFINMNKVPGIEEMMKVRTSLAYGEQRDYFDHPNIVGWTREGNEEHPDTGCAILLSNGGAGEKTMSLGKRNAHVKFKNVFGNRSEIVELNEEGEGTFFVNEYSASVWIKEHVNI